MNKKITLALVGVILLVSAIVLWNILQTKSEQLMTAEVGAAPIVSTSPAVKNKTVNNTTDSNDSDLKALDADLNSVDDNALNADSLSDQNVGL